MDGLCSRNRRGRGVERGRAGAQAQPVYKWVDADGKTHYGSQPPPARQDAEPLKLQSNNGTSGGSGSSSGKGASAKAG